MASNSIAALVSDNDSASFVTKSEFEALKNSFDQQIDKYNQSMEAMIDGAIAAYLAQLFSKKEEVSLPLQEWDSVTMMNGVIRPIFYYPSVNISAYLMGGFADGDSNDWINQYWAFANAIYNQSTTETSIRPTITNVKQDGTDETRMTWDGVKTNWIEKISANYNQGSTSNLYAFEIGGYTNRFFLYQFACFSGPGYTANLDNSISSIWKVNYGYYSNYSSYGYKTFTNGSNILNKNLVFEVSVGDTTYNHICNWSNSFQHWELYNEHFLNTFRLSNFDSLKANDWYNLMTKKGVWYGEKASKSSGGSTSRNMAHFSSLTMSNKTYNQVDTNYYIPRVGLYSNDVEPKNIYQTQDTYTQHVDNDEKELPKLNLVDGLVLFYAKSGDEIEWEPEFTNVLSSEAGLIIDSTEVCLMLSTIPFDDGATTEGTGDDDLISVYNFGSNVATKYPTSTNKKMKLKFKMPKDSFVYAKWYPVLSDSGYKDTKSWQVDLDLSSCRTYFRQKAE